MMKRAVPVLLTIALASCSALAVEDTDVLFFAPFEDSADAVIAGGGPEAAVTGAERFGEGVRGRAIILDAGSLLTYAFRGSVVPDEGTIMMWFKPEWHTDDGNFHRMFRAATGNLGGKALNAIMLYEYLRGDLLLFYTSNGEETAPSEGRTMARRDNLDWEPGQWIHVAATWSATLANTEMYLYLSGERVGAAAGAVFVPDRAPDSFDIGGPQGSGTTWFDDVLVFSRPLMAREIRAVCEAYERGTAAEPADLPFVSSRELQMAAHCNFGRGQVVVLADYRGARRDLGDRPGGVEVTVSREGGQGSDRAPTTREGVTRFTFVYDEVGAGTAVLQATLRDADGGVLRTGQLRYEVPARPVWLGNDLGKTDQVLPPWTPLRATEASVEMWGREYTLGASPLPTQVVSQERQLLRAPVRLSARCDGADASLEATPAGPPTGSDAASLRRWSGALGPLKAAVSSRVEFDGFMLLDLELTPPEPVQVEAMQLVVPLRPDAATLYHHCNGTWTDLSDAGAVGPAGWSKPLAFVPYVWLGTENAGLAWFCEHNWGWHNADGERVVELTHTEDGVDLIVRLVDEATTLSDPLHLTFGFMATPAKPMPEGWRDWRQMFVSALDLDGFVTRGHAQPGCRNIGVLWNNHVGNFSYLPADPEEMRRKVALLHDNDWQTVVSYFALDHTQTGTPDYALMEREWRRNPYGEAAFGEQGSHATVCNASTWADFLLWAIAKTMDETGTDGVYLDCSNPNFCHSPEHGCAPGRYPLLATRELQKRIYALVKERRGEPGFVYNHNSENNLMTTFSFSDAVLNGEQYNRKDLRTLTFDKFRAELSPQPYGVPAFLLPTLIKFQPDRTEKMPGPEFLAFPLLHDVICVTSWLGRDSQQLLRQIQAVLHDFGAADAEFLPYWDSAEELSLSSERATVSAYLRQEGGGLLLIAQGPEQPLALEVALAGRLAALRGAPARDALTGEPLQWAGGALRWPLPGRAVQLAIIEAPEQQ